LPANYQKKFKNRYLLGKGGRELEWKRIAIGASWSDSELIFWRKPFIQVAWCCAITDYLIPSANEKKRRSANQQKGWATQKKG
jgi:hypothetical protein